MRSSIARGALASLVAVAALSMAAAAAPALMADAAAGETPGEKTMTVTQETPFGEKKIAITYAGDRILRVIDGGKTVDPADFGAYVEILATLRAHDDFSRYADLLAQSTRGGERQPRGDDALRERMGELAARLDSLRAAPPLPAGKRGEELHKLLEESLFHQLLVCRLLDDGLISDPEQLDLRFVGGGMTVNGAPQPAEVAGRYRALLKQYGQEKIKGIRLGK